MPEDDGDRRHRAARQAANRRRLNLPSTPREALGFGAICAGYESVLNENPDDRGSGTFDDAARAAQAALKMRRKLTSMRRRRTAISRNPRKKRPSSRALGEQSRQPEPAAEMQGELVTRRLSNACGRSPSQITRNSTYPRDRASRVSAAGSQPTPQRAL